MTSLASVPDLLRLLVLPVFAWAAYRDVRTRRLPNRLWPPLVALGVVCLAWDVVARLPFAGFGDRLFLMRVAASLLVVAPLGYLLWRLGGFGGADAKAVMTLAVLLPTYPTYFLPVARLPALPATRATLGVFSLTVLTNTVLVGVAYPLALAARNAAAGRVSPAMFLARPLPVGALPTAHGRLFEADGAFTRRGLDLDALRMYLRWRGRTLADLRESPGALRDPDGVGETYPPTDGAVDADARPAPDGAGAGSRGGPADRVDPAPTDGDPDPDPEAPTHADANPDPWAAERFRAEVGTPYGATPETLRRGLETVAASDEVWVSPGLPFVVPMFLGLVVAFTYGDVLFGLLVALGFA